MRGGRRLSFFLNNFSHHFYLSGVIFILRSLSLNKKLFHVIYMDVDNLLSIIFHDKVHENLTYLVEKV